MSSTKQTAATAVAAGAAFAALLIGAGSAQAAPAATSSIVHLVTPAGTKWRVEPRSVRSLPSTTTWASSPAAVATAVKKGAKKGALPDGSTWAVVTLTVRPDGSTWAATPDGSTWAVQQG